MKTTLLLLAIVVIAVVIVFAIAIGKDRKPPSAAKPLRKRFLTEREEAMFNRLKSSLPAAHVLTQVSFGALLQAKNRSVRNTFDRKIADFVVCDQAMQVVAVIELDDASHKAKESSDRARDVLLEEAGYRVLRYKNIPDITQVQTDFKQLTNAAGVPYANHHESAGTSPVPAARTVLARETKPQSKRTA
jgi:very-short-patch-repair endonuclease